MKNRIHYFDIAKGVLILLLLVHHYGSARRRLEISNDDCFIIFNSWQVVFTAFFMQAFFIISGYCSNFNKPFKPFIISQTKQLIIPWISFEILSAVISAIRMKDFSFSYMLSIIFNETWTFYWFLNALFFSKVVVWIINKRISSHCFLIIITFTLFLIGIIINQHNWGRNIFCIRESLGSCLFVAVGLVLKDRTKLYDTLLKYCVYIYPLALLILIFLTIKIPIFTAGMHISLSQVPIFFITSLTGSFACLRLCKMLVHNKFLEFWGVNSLIVYCTHFWALKPLVFYFYNIFTPISSYSVIPYYSLIYISEIAFCWAMVKLFTSKYLKWITGSF